MRWPLLTGSFAALFLFTGCSTSAFQRGTCTAGSENCACSVDSTCDLGLECQSGLCVAAPAAGGATSVGGASTSTGTASAGGTLGTGGTGSIGGSLAPGGTRSIGGSPATGGATASGGIGTVGAGVVATHFSVSDGSAKLANALPPQSGGVSIFAWVKFPTNLTISTALAFGSSALFYQDYGFYADNAGVIWWWDENYGPDRIASNNGAWIFLIARFTSDTHVDIGYTRTSGSAITWSLNNTISHNPLQGMTVSFPGEAEWFGGDIAYAGVVPRAVDNTEASGLSNNAKSPSGAWAFWKFENGVTTDSSGNGRNWSTSGTITPAATGAPLASP
jgi:hypothetical protein